MQGRYDSDYSMEENSAESSDSDLSSDSSDDKVSYDEDSDDEIKDLPRNHSSSESELEEWPKKK